MMHTKNILIGIAILSAIGIHPPRAISQPPMPHPHPIQYRLSFRQAATHRVEVEASIPTDGAKSIRLMMPVWTPGSYLIREYARHVETIAARDSTSNQPLKLVKVDKNHWQVDCEGVQGVVLDYVLYGREMGVRTNWIENEFAFLTGAATFLTREDALDRPHIVRIDAIPEWTHVATSLKPLETRDPWTRRASDYHELVDSPIVLGNLDIQSETVGGATHHLASLGTDSMWDTRGAMKDVAKIVAIEQEFWGETPYQEYWFLNLATESGGGLEHDNSCVLMTSRWTQRQKSKYVDWLSLVSHEFFHVWNVRRLRPRALQNYDYNNEQYMRELWVAEGLTSYYDNLFVVRAGLCTPGEYLERVSKDIQTVENSPGRLVQNLEDSSFDTWIKFYRPDENANNARISYYVKGSLVGLLADAEIRLATDNNKSLDDCMRLLWQRHRTGGYTNADVEAILIEVGGEPIRGWLGSKLSETTELDYSRLLACYGLQWKEKNSESAAPPPATPAMLGMEISNQSGKAMVDKVAVGGGAAAAGIQSGDEWIGWDGYRVTPEQWSDRLGLYRAGDRVVATIARRGKLLQVPVEIPFAKPPSWNLVRSESPNEKQQERWRSWLEKGGSQPEEKTGKGE
jgi:predicted metalloprotease with PDZ domain